MNTMGCRQTRKKLGLLTGGLASDAESRRAVELHVMNCPHCREELRLSALARSVLDAAASDEAVSPGEDFYRILRARIARGPEIAPESSATLVWVTARQLIPAMTMLLMLIIGATLLWGQQAPRAQNGWVPPSDRLLLNEVYDYPTPTSDDVLETLIAVEDNTNGK